MYQTGLVSISFRKYSIEEIIAAVKAAGLTGIEWGSDVHVPVGNPEAARKVRAQMDAAGLKTCAYGSYYRLGTSENPAEEFAPYLDAAELLGAPVIRIWGGKLGSAELPKAQFEAAVAEGKQLAAMAGARGITLTLECHGHTFTDEYHSSLRYLREVNSPYMKMYWQPNQDYSNEYNLEAARALADCTVNLHVFNWVKTGDQCNRYPLAGGHDIWKQYLEIFSGADHWLLLEFMHDDRLETLAETAATLHQWLLP